MVSMLKSSRKAGRRRLVANAFNGNLVVKPVPDTLQDTYTPNGVCFGNRPSQATAADRDKVNVSGELEVDGIIYVTMTGILVAVKESHPVFYGWH
jgi:hypothetical protein